MLRFFSKIRYQLAAENKVAKYMRYAIGEILLVVIGILIALQVNNWNAQRKARIIENNFFEDVLEDLKKDQDRLNYYELFFTKRLEYLDTLLTYVRNPQKNMGIDKFGQYTEPLYYPVNPISYSTVFESAKSSGTFNEIIAKDLIKELSQYYSDFIQIENTFGSITRLVETQFEPLMYTLPEGYFNKETGILVINEENVQALYDKIASVKDHRNLIVDYQRIMESPKMASYLIGDIGRTYSAIGKIKSRQEKLKVLTQKIMNRD